ncbi:MAG: hypothetical protein WC284_08750 [Candidimonas sp.]
MKTYSVISNKVQYRRCRTHLSSDERQWIVDHGGWFDHVDGDDCVFFFPNKETDLLYEMWRDEQEKEKSENIFIHLPSSMANSAFSYSGQTSTSVIMDDFAFSNVKIQKKKNRSGMSDEQINESVIRHLCADDVKSIMDVGDITVSSMISMMAIEEIINSDNVTEETLFWIKRRLLGLIDLIDHQSE